MKNGEIYKNIYNKNEFVKITALDSDIEKYAPDDVEFGPVDVEYMYCDEEGNKTIKWNEDKTSTILEIQWNKEKFINQFTLHLPEKYNRIKNIE